MPYCFYPDAVGGTEIYVASLTQYLEKMGCSNAIAVPGPSEQKTSHNGIPVYRFYWPNEINDIELLYGRSDAQSVASFEEILKKEKPDIVHFHSRTPAVSADLIERIKSYPAKLIFTYHTPTATCVRGTLMQWGRNPCDGVLRIKDCAACVLHGKGLAPGVTAMMARIPGWFGRLLGRLNLQGNGWTALRMSALIESQQESNRFFLKQMDHIIATAGWAKDVLVRNGIDDTKVTVLKQGLCNSDDKMIAKKNTPLSRENVATVIKLVFLGRLDATKGIHILVEAILQEPHLQLTVDFYAIQQSEKMNTYAEQIFLKAQGDGRIKFKEAIPQHQVVSTLKDYDALVVPSQLMETGPMVVLEAFAAGIPVIGSDLGGIRDFVQDGINGLLVPFNDINQWRSVFRKISSDSTVLQELARNVKPPQTMGTVALHMKSIYEQILSEKLL